MTINYISTNNATLSASSVTINVKGSIDFSIVDNDYLIAINNGLYVVPALSGTAPDSDGNSTITLQSPWDGQPQISVSLFVFPTFANMSKTIGSMNALNAVSRGILERFSKLLTSNSESVDIRIGATESIKTTPYQYFVEKMSELINQTNSLVGSITAMTKPEFDTLRSNELKQHAVAGFLNTEFDSSFSFAQVNGWQNKFKLSANSVKIDGVWHDFSEQTITLNDALNGLQNIDLSQTDYPDLAAAIVAGGTSLSKSYLNQREIVIAAQSDIEVTVPNATNTAYIQESRNHVYSDNGVLRQRVLSFVVERLAESVPRATKNNFWRNTVNAMTSLGWVESPKIKGQWEKGELKATAIALVWRRNQGAGHPMNVAGCKEVNRGDGYYDKWHALSGRISSLSECFDSNFYRRDSGGIADTSGKNGQWNSAGNFYDAILASDVENLQIHAREVEDSKLLFDETIKSASSHVRGKESVPFTRIDRILSSTASGQQRFTVADGSLYSLNDRVNLELPDGTYSEHHVTDVEGNVLTVTSVFNRLNNAYIVHESYPLHHDSEEPTWTDIIGAPAYIFAVLTALGLDGVYAQWIPVIPDGAAQVRRLSRKANSIITQTYTTTAGVSWVSNIAGQPNSTTNEWNHAVVTNIVLFLNYKTQAHFTDESANRGIEIIRQDVFGFGDATANANIVSSLIGKIPNNLYGKTRTSVALREHFMIESSRKLHTSDFYECTHDNINLSGAGPAVKVLFSECEIDGFKAVQLTFKEMVYDNGWGDDNKFQITDGESTLPDENGNLVKYGTHVFVTNTPAET